MNIENISVIVLAAGKGTRLAQGSPSPKPKVLYEIGGKPIILHTLGVLKKVGLKEIILVIGHKGELVKQVVGNSYKFALQRQRLGTGHAAKVGLSQISSKAAHVMVLNGDDSAFYSPGTIENVVNRHLSGNNTLTFITLEPEANTGLGRIIRKNGKVVGIVEEKVASPEQKKIKEVNDGLYLFERKWLEKTLPKIKRSRVGEYYLVDLIKLAVDRGEKIEAYKLEDPQEWSGVNTPEELQAADKLMREKQANAG